MSVKKSRLFSMLLPPHPI